MLDNAFIASGPPAGIELSAESSDISVTDNSGVDVTISLYDIYGNPYDGDQSYRVDIVVDDSQTLTLASTSPSILVGRDTQTFTVYPNSKAGR